MDAGQMVVPVAGWRVAWVGQMEEEAVEAEVTGDSVLGVGKVLEDVGEGLSVGAEGDVEAAVWRSDGVRGVRGTICGDDGMAAGLGPRNAGEGGAAASGVGGRRRRAGGKDAFTVRRWGAIEVALRRDGKGVGGGGG